jgi:hypothetical protein
MFVSFEGDPGPGPRLGRRLKSFLFLEDTSLLQAMTCLEA